MFWSILNSKMVLWLAWSCPGTPHLVTNSSTATRTTASAFCSGSGRKPPSTLRTGPGLLGHTCCHSLLEERGLRYRLQSFPSVLQRCRCPSLPESTSRVSSWTHTNHSWTDTLPQLLPSRSVPRLVPLSSWSRNYVGHHRLPIREPSTDKYTSTIRLPELISFQLWNWPSDLCYFKIIEMSSSLVIRRSQYSKDSACTFSGFPTAKARSTPLRAKSG